MTGNRGGQPGNQNARTHGFYSKALTKAERLEMEDAARIFGIDDEIALLRVKLRELVENYPGRIDLQLKAANTIGRLCRTKYQIAAEQKAGLKEAIGKVLTEVALPLGINIGTKAIGK